MVFILEQNTGSIYGVFEWHV